MKNCLSEISAGGLVIKKTTEHFQKNDFKKILMVEVKNLEGKIVWTFPKGHLEKKESCEQAAVREVREETGWICRIISAGRKKHFKKVHYQFKRENHLVKKSVVWFLMVPLKKQGGKDPQEIRKVRWFSIPTAATKVRYPSDIKILKKLSEWLE